MDTAVGQQGTNARHVLAGAQRLDMVPRCTGDYYLFFARELVVVYSVYCFCPEGSREPPLLLLLALYKRRACSALAGVEDGFSLEATAVLISGADGCVLRVSL